MAEHVLVGPVNVATGEDGLRHLIVHDNGGDIYRMPLDAEGARKIGETLQASDEELQAMSERAAASEKLVLPGSGRDVRSPI